MSQGSPCYPGDCDTQPNSWAALPFRPTTSGLPRRPGHPHAAGRAPVLVTPHPQLPLAPCCFQDLVQAPGLLSPLPSGTIQHPSLISCPAPNPSRFLHSSDPGVLTFLKTPPSSTPPCLCMCFCCRLESSFTLLPLSPPAHPADPS